MKRFGTTDVDLIGKIKQLGDILTKWGKNNALILSHKQERLINLLHKSIYKEPVIGESPVNMHLRELMEQYKKLSNIRIVCVDTKTCRHFNHWCDRCSRNYMCTRGSDWSPDDWYNPGFKTGGVVSGPPIIIPEKDSFEIIYYPGYTTFNHQKFINQQLKNQQNMKATKTVLLDEMPDEITVNGKPYRLVPVEKELTLEDCVSGYSWFYNTDGRLMMGIKGDVGTYPTESIAEKVLLYGLLQSVAHKLNGGYAKYGYNIFLSEPELLSCKNSVYNGGVIFYSKELAEQAIDIFAKSKFDLKKLFQ